jgi:RHS repeat-associated protein
MRRWLSFLLVLVAAAALATVPRRPDSSSFAARCCADYHSLDRFAVSQQVCTFEPTSTLNGGGVSTNVGYYYSQDNLGSSTVLSDPNGVRLEINAFYPFGRSQTAGPQAGFQVSRRFTGQVFDGETGLYYYNARYYDPELGRFIQPDNAIPDLGNPQTYNRYSYCLNNPLRFTDPTGHAAEAVEVEPRVGFITQEILSGQRASRAEMGLRTSVAISSEIRIAGAPVRNGPVRATISEQGELWAVDPAEYAPKPAPAPVPQVNPEVRSAPTGNISQNAPAQQLEFNLTGGGARAGLATGTDQAVFWSGIGRGGAERAAAWAGQHGGVTLESTLASRGIALPVWDVSDPASVAAWRQASVGFAAGASGNVRVLQGDALRADALWSAEYQALQANPNVNSIRALNPDTGAETLLWSR